MIKHLKYYLFTTDFTEKLIWIPPTLPMNIVMCIQKVFVTWTPVRLLINSGNSSIGCNVQLLQDGRIVIGRWPSRSWGYRFSQTQPLKNIIEFSERLVIPDIMARMHRQLSQTNSRWRPVAVLIHDLLHDAILLHQIPEERSTGTTRIGFGKHLA